MAIPSPTPLASMWIRLLLRPSWTTATCIRVVVIVTAIPIATIPASVTSITDGRCGPLGSGHCTEQGIQLLRHPDSHGRSFCHLPGAEPAIGLRLFLVCHHPAASA